MLLYLDIAYEKQIHDWLIAAIESGAINSAHDLSDGGLMVTLAEMLFAEKDTFGADISLAVKDRNIRADELLFGESQGRIILACDTDQVDQLLASAEKAKLPVAELGKSNSSRQLCVTLDGDPLNWDVDELRSLWTNSIPDAMHE